MSAVSAVHTNELRVVAERMASAMLYEPTRLAMLVCCPSIGVYVGRVGIAGRPHASSDRSTDEVVLALTAGEPWAARVGDSGHDTPVGWHAADVVHAYRQYGDDAIGRAGGVYSGVLVDLHRQRCLIFSDRYGRERLFVCREGSRLYFSSEAKAILAVASEARCFDPDGLATLMWCGCTLPTQSLFSNVEVLEGGTLLAVERGTLTRRQWFDRRELENLPPASDDEFLSEFPRAVEAAVRACVRTEPEVGLSLTGGLDSRMVAASLEVGPGKAPCYTFGSIFDVTKDVETARRVAVIIEQPHFVFGLGRDFVQSAGPLLEKAVFASDGHIGLSGAAELYLNRLARELAPARMTGNWGGELMRGVRAFKFNAPRGDFLTRELQSRAADAETLFGKCSQNPISAALFQQIPSQGYGRYAIERSQAQTLTPFLADDVVQWLYRARPELRASVSAAVAVIERRPALLTIPTDQGLLDSSLWPIANLRRYKRRLIVKAEYLTSHGAPNWLARFSSALPDAMLETRFLGRDKFQHFRYWMRRELASGLEQLLVHDFDKGLDRWFNRSKVADMVARHIAGAANFTDELDKLATIATAQRCLLSNRSLGTTVSHRQLAVVSPVGGVAPAASSRRH